MKYVIQSAGEKTTCGTCGKHVDMLCPKDLVSEVITQPWFYICWRCRSIGQIGVGPVKRVRS
jgi:hypothetical protein